MIAFDTETFPIGLTEKTNVNPVPRMVCLTYTEDGKDARLERGKEACETFKSWLKSGAELVGHYVAFDVLVMLRACWLHLKEDLLDDAIAAYQTRKIRDTKLRQQLIDIATDGLYARGGYSLANLVKRHLGEDISATKEGEDVWRLRYNELDPYPTDLWPRAAVKYALDDARLTWRVWRAQQTPLENANGEQIAGEKGVAGAIFQGQADFGLALIQAQGLRLDADFTQKLADRYDAAELDYRGKLRAWGIVNEDGKTDTKTLKSLYSKAFDDVGLEPERTPKGSISTSQAARNQLTRAGYKADWFIASVEHARTKQYRSTYLDAFLEAIPYSIHPRYTCLVASGRTSVGGPNVQNLPGRDRPDEPIPSTSIRRCFIPRDGFVLASADWSAAELRALAQVNLNLGHTPVKMADAIRSGRDLHLAVAAEILGLNYEDADRSDPAVENARKVAKVANFGFPGGLQPGGFVSYALNFGVDVSYRDADIIYEHWKKAWPELTQYFDYIDRLERPDGSVVIEQHGPGRQIRGWRTRVCDRFTSACNTLFQGLAADGAKFALWQLQQECYGFVRSPLNGARVVAFIHDEFVVEVPEARAREAGARLREVMIKAMEHMTPDIPVEVDLEFSRRWAGETLIID